MEKIVFADPVTEEETEFFVVEEETELASVGKVFAELVEDADVEY